MRRPPIGVLIGTIASGLLLAGGAVVLIVARQSATASFGWFAYEPLAEAAVFLDSLIVFTPLTAAAASMVIAGLVGAAIIVGYLLGRRHRSSPER